MHPSDLERQPALDVPATPVVVPLGRRRAVPILPMAVLIVALLGGGALFMSGYSMGRESALEPGTPVDADAAFRPFWDTYHTIVQRYAGGDVDREAVVQGAIRGMIESLGDPYSSYLTSDEYRASLQGISGEFEGIGAEIATQGPDGTQGCATLASDCRLVIVAPIDGSPAQRAGLRPGDLVLAIDGTPLDGLTVDGARERIRGPKGSVVTLTVERTATEPFAVEITRDVILQREVETRVLGDGSVGYVRLDGFSDRGAEDLEAAVLDHLQADRDKLVLDLRGNPGGYVTAARAVASEFISDGPVFWEQDAKGSQLETRASLGGVATDPSIEVVVLIDGGTASASEIVAGALQDTDRATLIGQPSFGKGTVQQWQELAGEGGAFRLTIARWLTPEKRWIHEVGLQPDVLVEVPADPASGSDAILDKALEVLDGGPRGAAGSVGA